MHYLCIMEEKKLIIYQLMPRWFTNCKEHCVPNGSIRQNGVGKFNEIDESRLHSIKSLGATHVSSMPRLPTTAARVFPRAIPMW